MARVEEVLEIVDNDLEMKQWLLASILKPGDKVKIADTFGVVLDTPIGVYYGRLANPGCKPGFYHDFKKIMVKQDDGKHIRFPIEKVVLENFDEYKTRIEKLSDAWHFIDLSLKFRGDLPETKFIESDVVRLIDESHDEFTKSFDLNQFTVYRIDYSSAYSQLEKTKYQLRAGEKLFYAFENQLDMVAYGPIRIYEGGQPLVWRSLKDEAEFHLLIGKYRRSYNPITKSYKWPLEQARQTIQLGKAHGILKIDDLYELIIFDDEVVGREVAAADLILTC